jgi:membrane protease YdiL (CAAX protease family)
VSAQRSERPAHARGGASPALLAAAAYTCVTLVAVVIGLFRGAPDVLVDEALHRFPGGPLGAHAVSLAVGLALSAALVVGTRRLVRTRPWAAALHEDLRPFARALGPDAILVVAIASSIGEETLFRGALVPAVGPIVSSLLFGVLHQLRGRSRVAWWLFATIVGLAFAYLFRFTGSLLGPIVAHAVVNAVNLRFLLTHDPHRAPQLGGLLGGRR